ncbi:MAG: prolyl-tRNA synthetase associated domain-containing protein [Clostridia bacterium]|nr:prolyl-tRNA synthetase associated domain-containing protein [Clostridia bacterium]
MLKAEKGRPANLDDRLQKEIKVYDLLDSLNIEYERVDHERADTMEACIEVDKVLNTVLCKNLFLCNRQKTIFYLLLMPADKVFKTKELSAQIGSSRLSFASPEDMISHLDIEPGSVSVMGLMNDPENEVNLLIDKDLMKEEYFGCHPCVNTSSLKLKTSDLLTKFLPAVHHTYIEVELFGVE